MADDSIINYSDLIGDDGAFDDILKNLKVVEKELIASAKRIQKAWNAALPQDTAQIEKLEKETNDLAKAQQNYAKALNTVNKAKKKNNELTDEEIIAKEKARLEQKERVKLLKAQAREEQAAAGSIEELRAQLAKTTLQWKNLSKEERENSKLGKDLIKEKKRLTEELKALEKATGDNRRNVGNYNSALKGLRRTFIQLFVGRSIVEGVRRLGSAFTDIIEKGKDSNERFKALDDSFKILQQNLTSVATTFLNFIAPVLTQIVQGFTFLVSTIASAASSLFDFANSFTPVRVAIEAVTFALTNIPAIFGGIVESGKQLAFNIGNQFRKLGLDLQILFAQINKVNPFTTKNINEINREIAGLRDRYKTLTNEQGSLIDAFSRGFNETKAAQDDFTANQEVINENTKTAAELEAERTKELERQNTLIVQQSKLQSDRIKAIESLQKQISQAEVKAGEDRQAALFRLEELRFQAEQRQRENNFNALVTLIEQQEQNLINIYGENSGIVLAFRDEADKELLALEAQNQKLSEAQLRVSEQNKINIRKKFAIETAEIEALTQEKIAAKRKAEQDKLNEQLGFDAAKLKKQQEEIAAEDAKANKQRLEAQAETQKQILEQVGETAEKIGAEIVKVFEKQADLAEDSVNRQEENLSRARDRAARGLEANIAFEEQELARRQAEQQRRQKEAQQAAKLLSLFNLVSAYAQSGDENALFRALADFAILEAFSAGIQGFYEGTEDTGTVGNALDNKGGRLAILHDNERVVTKAQNMLLGGMSNDQLVKNALLGEQMGDYFNPSQGFSTMNVFGQQREAFVKSMKGGNSSSDNSGALIREVQQMRRDLKRVASSQVDVVKIYENIYGIIQSENKGNFKKINKYKLKPRF